MSRKTEFTPEQKEQAVIDYLKRNKSRAQICEELRTSSRTIQDRALVYNRHGIAGFSKKYGIALIRKDLKGKWLRNTYGAKALPLI